MSLQSYYDKHSRNYSLNWAIAITVVFAFYAGVGLLLFLRYFSQHDSFYLFVGPLSVIIGILGIFQGAQIIHAVVRRQVSQASNFPTI